MKYLIKKMAIVSALLVVGGGMAAASVFDPAKVEVFTEARKGALEGIDGGTDIAPVSRVLTFAPWIIPGRPKRLAGLWQWNVRQADTGRRAPVSRVLTLSRFCDGGWQVRRK